MAGVSAGTNVTMVSFGFNTFCARVVSAASVIKAINNKLKIRGVEVFMTCVKIIC